MCSLQQDPIGSLRRVVRATFADDDAGVSNDAVPANVQLIGPLHDALALCGALDVVKPVPSTSTPYLMRTHWGLNQPRAGLPPGLAKHHNCSGPQMTTSWHANRAKGLRREAP